MFTNLSPISVSSSSHLYARKGNGTSKEPSGLKNLGNTCFMNSVLQCLYHCHKFCGTVLQSEHRISCTETECIECAIENCILEMRKGSTNPTPALVKLLPRISSGNLSFGRQEDAHEFLISLIMSIKHNDATISKKVQISELFHGVILSRICCFNCRKISSKEDPSIDIALDISKSKSITNALTDFCEVERLSGDNSYNCSHCKTTTLAQKCLRFQSCPDVLIVQLKRFTYDETGKTTKLNHWVEFPECLNLNPYVFRENIKNGEPLTNGSGHTDCYELKSIVLHIGGTIHSGHYISYVKTVNENGLRSWFKMDDLTVTQVPASEVLGQTAYLLFYERISEKEYKLLVARQQFTLDKPFYSEVLPQPDVRSVAAPAPPLKLQEGQVSIRTRKGDFIQRSRPASVSYSTSSAILGSKTATAAVARQAVDERHRSLSIPEVAHIYRVNDDLTAVLSTVNHIDMHANPMKGVAAGVAGRSPGSEGKRKFTPGLSYNQYEEGTENSVSYENYYRPSGTADTAAPVSTSYGSSFPRVTLQSNFNTSAEQSTEAPQPTGVTPLNDLLTRKVRLDATASPNKKRKDNAGESIDLYQVNPQQRLSDTDITHDSGVSKGHKSKRGSDKKKIRRDSNKGESVVESGLRYLGNSLFSAFKSVRKSLINMTSSKEARAERRKRKLVQQQAVDRNKRGGVERRLWADSAVKAAASSATSSGRPHLDTVREGQDEGEGEGDDMSATSEDSSDQKEDWDILSRDSAVEENQATPLHHTRPTGSSSRDAADLSPVLDVSDIIFEEEDSRFYLGTEPSTPGVSSTPFRQQRDLQQHQHYPQQTPDAHNISYGSIYSSGFDAQNTSNLSMHKAISEYRASLGVNTDAGDIKTPMKPSSSMNNIYAPGSAAAATAGGGIRMPLNSSSYSPYTSHSNLWGASAAPTSGVKSHRIVTQLPPPASAGRGPPMSAYKAPPKDIPLWQQQLNYLQSHMKSNEDETVANNSSHKDIGQFVNKVLFDKNEIN